MTRRTKKYSEAIKVIAAHKGMTLPNGGYTANQAVYDLMKKNGWSWDSEKGEWGKFAAPENAFKTGVVDVRMRATLGDIERAAKLIGFALEAAGFKIVRMSAPDPDDRHGAATTARIYMQWIMPNDSNLEK